MVKKNHCLPPLPRRAPTSPKKFEWSESFASFGMHLHSRKSPPLPPEILYLMFPQERASRFCFFFPPNPFSLQSLISRARQKDSILCGRWTGRQSSRQREAAFKIAYGVASPYKIGILADDIANFLPLVFCIFLLPLSFAVSSLARLRWNSLLLLHLLLAPPPPTPASSPLSPSSSSSFRHCLPLRNRLHLEARRKTFPSPRRANVL